MIDGNIVLSVVPETLDEQGEHAKVTKVVVPPNEILEETVGKLDNLAPLASDAILTDVIAKVNELIAALKNGYMKRDWTVTTAFTHITGSNDAETAPDGTEYVNTLTADDGYALPDTVVVMVDGEEIDEGYTWAQDTGVLTVSSVDGDLEIVAEAGEAPEPDPPESDPPQA